MANVPAPRQVPMRGIPLEVKLAASVALLVAAFMAGFGLLLHGTLVDLIGTQLLHEAVNAARTAAHIDIDAWSQKFATVDEGLTAEEIQARIDAETREQYQAYMDDGERKTQIEWNKGRGNRLLADDTRILAFEVFRWKDDIRGPAVCSAYAGAIGRVTSTFTVNTGTAPLRIGVGDAQAGVLAVGENTWRAIRGSYPMTDRDGTQNGEVVVFIDAVTISEAAAGFSRRVAYAGIGFILVSVVLAFLVARTLTSPVRRLRDDAQAVVAGDLQHRTHPHSSDEIGQLARTFEYMTRWLAKAQAAEHEVETFRHELEAAASVTASLFPQTLPEVPGWSLGGLHDREASPGGGTYDVLPMADGRLGVFVAEASSGGAPGALVAAMARASLRFAAERHTDPAAVLREVNAHLTADLGQDMQVAVMLIALDPASGSVTMANAGHRPLLHYHASRDSLALVPGKGLALGSVGPAGFDAALEATRVKVEPGDDLILFASEISLLSGPDGEVLGERRLAALVKQAAGPAAGELVTRVGAALRKYHGGDSLGADVTLFAIGRDKVG